MVRTIILMLFVILMFTLISCATISNDRPTFGKEVNPPQGWIDYCNRPNTKDVDCK